MVRQVIPARRIAVDHSSDVQRIINDQPSTATILRRKNKSTAQSQQQWDQVASFECRLDSYRPRISGGERVGTAGEVTQHTYLLLARFGQDQFGNDVDIMHEDTVQLDTTGKSYRCLTVVYFSDSSKIEAILLDRD